MFRFFFAFLILTSSYCHAATQEKPDAALRALLTRASAIAAPAKGAAEVWLLDMSTRLQSRIEDTERRLNLLKEIHYEATRAKLPPELVLAVIDTESRFDRWAISEAGAQGLMQIMPFWLKEIHAGDNNLFSIRTNLRFGCTILRYYLDKEHGDLVRGLARYNGSVGSTRYSTKVLDALSRHWFRQ